VPLSDCLEFSALIEGVLFGGADAEVQGNPLGRGPFGIHLQCSLEAMMEMRF
jgi:hypothetical protein